MALYTQQDLESARRALKALNCGEMVVSVSHGDGGSVQYNQTSKRNLQQYISEIEADLGALSPGRRRGSVTFRM